MNIKFKKLIFEQIQKGNFTPYIDGLVCGDLKCHNCELDEACNIGEFSNESVATNYYYDDLIKEIPEYFI